MLPSNLITKIIEVSIFDPLSRQFIKRERSHTLARSHKRERERKFRVSVYKVSDVNTFVI